jgi:hypothetical protein
VAIFRDIDAEKRLRILLLIRARRGNFCDIDVEKRLLHNYCADLSHHMGPIPCVYKSAQLLCINQPSLM